MLRDAMKFRHADGVGPARLLPSRDLPYPLVPTMDFDGRPATTSGEFPIISQFARILNIRC
jgi:hypothetical protein